MNTWVVYVLRCSDNSLYTGICKDIDRRVHEHNHNNRLAAAYTRSRRPVKLVYYEDYPDRSTASQREAAIKKLSHKEKKSLIGMKQ